MLLAAATTECSQYSTEKARPDRRQPQRLPLPDPTCRRHLPHCPGPRTNSVELFSTSPPLALAEKRTPCFTSDQTGNPEKGSGHLQEENVRSQRRFNKNHSRHLRRLRRLQFVHQGLNPVSDFVRGLSLLRTGLVCTPSLGAGNGRGVDFGLDADAPARQHLRGCRNPAPHLAVEPAAVREPTVDRVAQPILYDHGQ